MERAVKLLKAWAIGDESTSIQLVDQLDKAESMHACLMTAHLVEDLFAYLWDGEPQMAQINAFARGIADSDGPAEPAFDVVKEVVMSKAGHKTRMPNCELEVEQRVVVLAIRKVVAENTYVRDRIDGYLDNALFMTQAFIELAAERPDFAASLPPGMLPRPSYSKLMKQSRRVEQRLRCRGPFMGKDF